MKRQITSGNRRIHQSAHRYCCWSLCYFELALLSKIKRTRYVTSSRCPTKRSLWSFPLFTYYHLTVLWQSNGTYGSDKVMKPSSFHFNFLSKQIIEEFINTGPFKGFSFEDSCNFSIKSLKSQQKNALECHSRDIRPENCDKVTLALWKNWVFNCFRLKVVCQNLSPNGNFSLSQLRP